MFDISDDVLKSKIKSINHINPSIKNDPKNKNDFKLTGTGEELITTYNNFKKYFGDVFNTRRNNSVISVLRSNQMKKGGSFSIATDAIGKAYKKFVDAVDSNINKECDKEIENENNESEKEDDAIRLNYVKSNEEKFKEDIERIKIRMAIKKCLLEELSKPKEKLSNAKEKLSNAKEKLSNANSVKYNNRDLEKVCSKIEDEFGKNGNELGFKLHGYESTISRGEIEACKNKLDEQFRSGNEDSEVYKVYKRLFKSKEFKQKFKNSNEKEGIKKNHFVGMRE